VQIAVVGRLVRYAMLRIIVVTGTLTLACKLPVNDRAKFMALLIGITFAVPADSGKLRP
jgi:hypothetical protein